MSNETEFSDVNSMLVDSQKIRSMVHGEMLDVNRALHEKLVDYVRLHELTERSLFGEVSDHLIRLDTAGWGEFELEIARIRQDPALAEEDRRMVEQSFRQNIENSSQRELKQLRSLLTTQLSSLQSLRRFALDADELEADVAREVVKLDASIEKARQAYEEKKIRKAELDTLVDTFGQNSVSKVFKNMIPTAEQIQAATQILQGQLLDVSALTDVAKTLEQNIDVLSEGRQYSTVVAARDRVRIALEAQLKDLQTAEAIRGRKQRELEQTRLLPSLRTLREHWLGEADKVPAGLALRLASFDQRLSAESNCEGLLAIAAYFKAVRARYNNH